MLVRLSEALGIRDLAELTGDVSLSVEHYSRGEHPAVLAIRDAVMGYRLPSRDRAPIAIPELADRIGYAWRLWHTDLERRVRVGSLLPGLMTDTQHAALVLTGADRKAAHVALADVYHLAQHVLVNAAEPHLVWLMADRAMSAAQEANDPVAIAGAAWTVGMMLRGSGRMDEAVQLVTGAANDLEPLLNRGDAETRAMFGALHLHTAVTLARVGRDGEAWAAWGRAEAAAAMLPAGYAHPWTVFGAANVELHAVSLTVDLWKSRDALRRAEQINPDHLPSRERRGRLFVELARSYQGTGDRVSACRMLLRACDEGVDAVAWSPAAGLIVDDLVARAPAIIRNDVVRLTHRLDPSTT